MFSCDVVASETQSAPLWEEVKRQNNDSVSEKREVKEQDEAGTSRSNPHKRPSKSSWHLKRKAKRRKMLREYTECKLCELKFHTELELEEHLFSMLHHRTLNTEYADCRQECNLCSVACKNLSEYVQHLKNPSHRVKNGKRKAAIKAGTYNRPENNLAGYASSFMIPPTRTNQHEVEEEANKKVKEIVSKENKKETTQNARSRVQTQQNKRGTRQYYNDDPYHWYPEQDTRYPEKDSRNRKYPDWHPMGSYGQQSHGYYETGYDSYYHQQGYNNRVGCNPYEGDWIPGSSQRMGQRMFHLERLMYNTKDEQRKKSDSKRKSSLPATPVVESRENDMRLLTHNQSRTNELVARAHQVIQNGQNTATKSKKREKNKKGKNKSGTRRQSLNQSSSSGLSQDLNRVAQTTRSQSTVSEFNSTGLVNMEKDLVYHHNAVERISSRHDVSVLSSISSRQKKTKTGRNKPGSRQRAKDRQNHSAISSRSTSISSKEGLKTPGLPDRSQSREKVAVNAVKLPIFHKIRPQLGDDANINRPKTIPKTAPRRINRSVLEKFRNQISKELGPARVKKTPKRRSANTSKSGSSVSSAGTIKSMIRQQRSEPGSTENIRAQFRKILDDIDQPVMSASEVLRNAERNDLSASAADYSQTTSWAESSRVSNVNPNSVDMTNSTLSGEMSQNTSMNLGNFTYYTDPKLPSDLTQYTSLPDAIYEERQTNTSLDRSNTLKQSVSIDSEGNCNTPLRAVILLSSDIDTPTNKKRPCPQPNLNRARSRLTSKQKDSPDVPSEIRQAKLKQLLLKYDKTKKNSPDTTGNFAKKAPGPRFGIQLNLQSRPVDMEDFAKKAELVEILPEMRVRSLSESDSMVSFTTAATESTTSLSSTINPPNTNVPKPTGTQPQQEPQRTSTPTVPHQPDPQTLNAKLLVMSEREESLHSSARSLSLQEANMQCDIDNKTAVLTALQRELEKMNERKLCVEALRKRHERELEELRQERLMLLRGSMSAAHDATTSQGNIFQDFTPTCRRAHSTAAFPPNQPTEETVFRQKQASAGDCAPTVTSHPVGNSDMPTENGVLPDFDISKVKSEPSTAVDDDSARYPVPSGKQSPNIQLEGVKIKAEILEECSGSVSYRKTAATEKSAAKDCPSQNTVDTQATQNANSTLFYSMNNDNGENTSQTAEVDRILTKYTNCASTTDHASVECGTSNNASPTSRTCQKQRKQRTTSRRSPRFLSEGQQAQSTSTPPSSEPLVTRTVVYTLNEDSRVTDEKLLPKFLKAHDLPLVGMQLINQGLVTCSTDETVALHTADGKKYSLTLGATPTAMTAMSEDNITLVFVATQKLISKRQSSDDSVVVNKMEHWLNVYFVQNPEGLSAETVFQTHSRLKMKTRVLCVHYDKQTLFCAMRDGIVAIITLNSQYQPEKDINILECHSHSAIACLTTGMEGARRILCCGSTDCTVSVRDAVEGLLLRTIQGHTKTVTCLQLVQNKLYSASIDRLVLCHNLNTGSLLHRFTGHVGVVRSIYVASDVMVTLCSDRNIRFFDTKTSRLIQKPKPVSALPLYACMQAPKNGAPGRENIVFVGCEDSTVIQVRFPQTHKPIGSSSTEKSNSNSPIREKDRPSSKSPQRIINLTGEFQCKWEGCTGAGTFVCEEDLYNHVFSFHVDSSELTQIGDFTLRVGTCCQWESCTHYFAPELDTIRDVTAHVQRHFKNHC